MKDGWMREKEGNGADKRKKDGLGRERERGKRSTQKEEKNV